MTKTDGLEARLIPLVEIGASPYNTRRIFKPEKLAEMADSIRANGVIQPLIVRLAPQRVNGIVYELVAGERRLRGAALAELVKVPCIVCDLDDLTVLDQQLIENVQREDLHPLEEAAGYQQRKDAGASIDDMVKITGKDRTTISRRLQLLNLIPEAQEVFLRDGMLPKHALMIARLPAAEQPKAFAYTMGVQYSVAAKVRAGEELKLKSDAKAQNSPSEVRDFIERVVMRPLSAAPWSKKDTTLVPEAGACNVCSKRTGNNPLLFDEGEQGKNDRCLDGECYERKFEAHLVQIETKAKAKGDALVRLESGGCYTVWKEVHGDRCASEVKGLRVDGNDRGQVIRACLDKKCTAHWGSRSGSGRSVQERDREQKLILERKYRARLWTEVSRAVQQLALEEFRAIALHMWDRCWHDLKKAYMGARGIEAPKSAGGGTDTDKPVARLIQAMKTSRELQVWMYTFTLFRDAYVQNYERKSTKDDLHAAAARLKVDAGGIRKEIEAEFAEKRAKRAEAEKKKKQKAKSAAAQGKLL